MVVCPKGFSFLDNSFYPPSMSSFVLANTLDMFVKLQMGTGRNKIELL